MLKEPGNCLTDHQTISNGIVIDHQRRWAKFRCGQITNLREELWLLKRGFCAHVPEIKTGNQSNRPEVGIV